VGCLMRRPFPVSTKTGFFGQVRRWQSTSGQWWSDTHKGNDYGVPKGAPILAKRSGRVKAKGFLYAIGYYVIVQVSDRKTNRYHMLNAPSPLSVGQEVTEGQTVVGFVGMSGASATGPHLHEQDEVDGVPVDPELDYTAALAGNITTVIPARPEKEKLNIQGDIMLLQVTIPQVANPDALDTYMLNAADHTYWWVANTVQKNFHYSAGIPTFEKQSRDILAGYVEITKPA
jgi:murein DD-endopeptidase MepM/ murein hydrolase activator NlpD